MTGTPLPPNDFERGVCYSAYDKCLHYESNPAGSTLSARALGYLLREALDEEGRDHLAGEINLCQDNSDKFNQLGSWYIDHFVRYFRAHKSSTPTPSDHPSRPSVDNGREFLENVLEEPSRSHSVAKQKALLRDGYRCMLTGAYDMDSLEAGLATAPDDAPTATTQAAHILPSSTNRKLSGQREHGPKAATVWTILALFGNKLVLDELNGRSIHRENVMTLHPSQHTSFDSLHLWLESTDVPHTFKPNGTSPFRLRNLPERVTFSTSDPIRLPLPSPIYLRFHAAAARVAHLSGVG